MIFPDRKILKRFENEIGLTKLLREQLNEEIRIQIIIHSEKNTKAHKSYKSV